MLAEIQNLRGSAQVFNAELREIHKMSSKTSPTAAAQKRKAPPTDGEEAEAEAAQPKKARKT